MPADSRQVAIGRDGRFEFAGLAPGPYEVWTAVRGYGLPGKDRVLKVTVGRDASDLAIRLERR